MKKSVDIDDQQYHPKKIPFESNYWTPTCTTTYECFGCYWFSISSCFHCYSFEA